MAYYFHNEEFIKGKVVNNVAYEDEDEYGTPIKKFCSKFISENNTEIIAVYSNKFPYPVGKTKKSCWKNTVEYYDNLIKMKKIDLTYF